MGTDLLQILGALVLLCLGGEALVRGAQGLGARLGLSALSMGLTIVAFGTSAPELVVSLEAARAGAGEIALGNVIGSNIANIALILGLSALVRPLRVSGRLVRAETPLMVVVSLALLAILWDGVASRLEGALLVAGLLAFVVLTLRAARRAPDVFAEAVPGGSPGDQVEAAGQPGAGLSLGLVVVGLSLLVVGGQLLVAAAVSLASGLGIGQAAIGLTVVAVGTSLPEMATSIVAGLRSQGDIAVGNVVGSNLFNILGILGLCALIAPLRMGAIGSVDLLVLVGTAIALSLWLRRHQILGRGAGALLLLSWLAYTTHLLAG